MQHTGGFGQICIYLSTYRASKNIFYYLQRMFVYEMFYLNDNIRNGSCLLGILQKNQNIVAISVIDLWGGNIFAYGHTNVEWAKCAQ